MDFDFTDDQDSLRDAVRRWADKAFPFERRHAIAKAGGATREVMGELAELGLAGLVVAEAHGGLAFGPVEAMVVGEELGRGIVNAPWADACLVAPAMLAGAAGDVAGRWLPKIAAGEAVVMPATQEHAARYRWRNVAATAQAAGAGHTLRGHKTVVPAGDEADAFLVPAMREGRLALFLVERGAAGLGVRGYPTQDGARAADLVLDGAAATLVEADAEATIERAIDVRIAAACAEGVGLMDRLVAITVDYLNTRRQFGVPIASFQALRHRMADVKMQQELARSMSYFASLKLGEPAPARRRALSQAKVQLGASMRFVGQQCIQLHGGIGCTDEYIASHLFKRLTMLEMVGGDSLHHLGEVSERMQDTAGVFA
jgi:alkylation response protein AidB-like acyl-CoA dehydrogenase